jgi:hypothetical protein
MKYLIILFKALICIVIITFTSCNKSWKTYVVKAGHHSGTGSLHMITGVNEIDFKFKTDSSWYYVMPAEPGWNKIRGFSEGHHQTNSSARLGYQCIDDTLLVVGGYCYKDGVSPQENNDLKGIIDTIQPGQQYHCIIKREDGKYKFFFEEKYWDCPAGENLNWGYLLNPYIGGDFTLDHDWKVRIKDIEP